MINEPTNEQKAILNYNGNTVVTANPGSGKTYTVVEKIGKVLHDLPSYKGIIAISFTNKASDELKKRCKRKGINAKSSFFGTIDKFYISEIIIPYAFAYAGSSGLSKSPSRRGVLRIVSAGTVLPFPLSLL